MGGSRGFNVIYTTNDELVSKCEITILPASYPSSSFFCVPATMTSEPTRSQELSEKGSPYDGASSTSNSNSNNNNNSNNNSNDNEKSAVVVKSQDDQDEASSTSVSEVFDVKQFDPVLARKMALVNQAIDEIGMTSFQWNLFWLNGFGYTVDSVCSSHPDMLFSEISCSKLTCWKRSSHAASCCLPVHRKSCRSAGVWKSQCSRFRHSPGFADWTPSRRWSLGFHCRYYRPEAGV